MALAVEIDCKNELDHYKRATKLPLRIIQNGEKIFSDPLLWWKQNEHKFPILARLARIYLAVQPSSAPSERIFSAASRLLSARRSTMDPVFAGKAFFVGRNWDWFESQVSLAQLELDQCN